MAVFHLPRGPAQRRGSLAGKLFKTLVVALLMGGLGLGVMCYLDAGVRVKVAHYYNAARAKLGWPESSGLGGFVADPPPPRTPAVDPATPATNQEPTERTAQQSRAKVWDYWKSAQDAEKRNDWNEALRHLEAIRGLGVAEDDLPLGLDMKIANAKKKLGQ